MIAYGFGAVFGLVANSLLDLLLWWMLKLIFGSVPIYIKLIIGLIVVLLTGWFFGAAYEWEWASGRAVGKLLFYI